MAVTNAIGAEGVDESHTDLESVIKIRLSNSTNARMKVTDQFRIFDEDGHEQRPDNHRSCSRSAVAERQKTNIVLYTREECESLLSALKFANVTSRQTRQALERVRSELRTELKFQGLRIDESDSEHYPVLEEYEGAIGSAPENFQYEVDDLVEVSWRGERKNVRIAALGPESALLEHSTITTKRRAWVEHSAINGLDTEAMEERARERNRVTPRDKRMQADLEALADLCKRHAAEKADEVWGSTIDVEDIEFEFNARFSSIAGQYTQRWKSDGPKIQLSPGSYYAHGLEELLATVRHEMIHAWQDFHPDSNSRENLKHHGRDFTQWLDDMDTGRYCKHY